VKGASLFWDRWVGANGAGRLGSVPHLLAQAFVVASCSCHAVRVGGEAVTRGTSMRPGPDACLTASSWKTRGASRPTNNEGPHDLDVTRDPPSPLRSAKQMMQRIGPKQHRMPIANHRSNPLTYTVFFLI
jgi:hypothetical protein